MKKPIELKKNNPKKVGERVVRTVTPAEVLNHYRIENNFSFGELEKVSGIRRTNLCAIEYGKRALGLKTAKTLGWVFNCDYRDFL